MIEEREDERPWVRREDCVVKAGGGPLLVFWGTWLGLRSGVPGCASVDMIWCGLL